MAKLSVEEREKVKEKDQLRKKKERKRKKSEKPKKSGSQNKFVASTSLFISPQRLGKAVHRVKEVTPVRVVHYWSDGAGSQFKNRYNLSSLLYHEEDFNCKATWSFFETAHGKGPVDGVGEVKRAVWRSILQNNTVVTNPEELPKNCARRSKLFMPQSL